MFDNRKFDRTTFLSSGGKLNYRHSNGSIILKMIVTQVVMVVFSLTVQAALGMTDNSLLLLLGSIVSVVFYMFLLYTTSWEVGITESVSVENGKSEYRPLRFVPLAVIANALNIILVAATIIGYLFNGGTDVETVRWAYSVYGVSNNIMRVLESMYAGALYFFGVQKIPYYLILTVIPPIVFSELGYYVGLKGKTIRGFLGIKTKYDIVDNGVGAERKNSDQDRSES